MDMLGRYLLTLLLTITVEGSIAYLLGFRTRQSMLVIALINVITHVSLNYLILVFGSLGLGTTIPSIAVLEVLIVIAEWQMLVYAFHGPKGRFLLTSILANAASFFIGVLLFWK